MILYHFPTSPFARRVRLALAHKKLSAELRDARAVPEHRAEVNRLNPLHTVPVLVDEGTVVVDSTAICHYLERKFPDPPLWPAGTAVVTGIVNVPPVPASAEPIVVTTGAACATRAGGAALRMTATTHAPMTDQYQGSHSRRLPEPFPPRIDTPHAAHIRSVSLWLTRCPPTSTWRRNGT